MLQLIVSIVTFLCTIHALTVVQESVRSFEFPSNGQAPQPQPQSQGLDLSSRQGLTTGTVNTGAFPQFPNNVNQFPNQSPQQFNPFIVNNFTTGVCLCVTSGSCSLAGGGSTGGSVDGSGLIDVRIINSGIPSTTITTGVGASAPVQGGLTPQIITPSVCQFGLDRCCPTSGYSCGIRYPPISTARPPTAGQAAFGAYPWQAVILANDVYVGSGALIDNFHIITAAHRVNDYLTNGRPLRIRLGEWDASNNNEPIPSQEYTVARIFIHPSFTASNLRNDIAIIRLSSSVPLGQTPTITTACLPSVPLSGTRCWISGWGKNDFSNNGAYQAIQKEVDVPLVTTDSCQNSLRTTRLGTAFVLDTTSFICAGGEPGKDACTGDGGSPLACLSGGRWFVVGLVAWGIGCGSSGVPGVYVNVASYISWIQTTVRS